MNHEQELTPQERLSCTYQAARSALRGCGETTLLEDTSDRERYWEHRRALDHHLARLDALFTEAAGMD